MSGRPWSQSDHWSLVLALKCSTATVLQGCTQIPIWLLKAKHRIWPLLTTYNTVSLDHSPWLLSQVTRIPANPSLYVPPLTSLALNPAAREILLKHKSDHVTLQHVPDALQSTQKKLKSLLHSTKLPNSFTSPWNLNPYCQHTCISTSSPALLFFRNTYNYLMYLGLYLLILFIDLFILYPPYIKHKLHKGRDLNIYTV